MLDIQNLRNKMCQVNDTLKNSQIYSLGDLTYKWKILEGLIPNLQIEITPSAK